VILSPSATTGRTNRLERGDTLIDPVTFDVWRLRTRDEDLDRDDQK
jgi:hypothetical protein